MQFLGKHRGSGRADQKMDLAIGEGQLLQESHGEGCTAGSSHRENNRKMGRGAHGVEFDSPEMALSARLFDPGIESDHPECHRTPSYVLESDLAQHTGEFFAAGKLADALREILVRFARVLRDRVAYSG